MTANDVFMSVPAFIAARLTWRTARDRNVAIYHVQRILESRRGCETREEYTQAGLDAVAAVDAALDSLGA